jgi:hypothetical protein
MSKNDGVNPNTPIQFEDGYIFRNNRSITSTPDIAITEFVANAWDAGAYSVGIIIPEEEGEVISVEDDGIGMSDVDFRQMWMTLNYDRQKRQGKIVTFPPEVEAYKRIAYGRNGVGRHGMLCFADYYTVETWQNGICNKYDIAISSGDEPFKIFGHISYEKNGHGTKISAYVHRHLPDATSMIDIISARFLYDPKFIVKINGKHVDLLDHKGVYEKKDILLENGVNLHLTIIDSTKTALKSQQHGIAFWVSGRLVGKPSWSYGEIQFLDGRFRIAKKYTLIVQTDDIIDYVLPDWTGFIDDAKMKEVYSQLKKHVDDFLSSVMAEQIGELQQDIIRETRDGLETLSPMGQRDVSTFIEAITTRTPTVNPDFLKTAVEAVIRIEQAKKGEQLLMQLCEMSQEDIDKLSDLLKEWDVDDILSVINEIDKRIAVVEAIDRVFNDKRTDELHTLHPLVLNARWLFGAEFDSPMYVSNSALTTVVKTLFKNEDYDLSEIANPRKRPDIVCLNQSTIRAVCTDRPDNDAGGVMKPDQILLVELKRGGYTIGASEVSQAEHYVRQIRKSAVLHKVATITSFVVGAVIGDVDSYRGTASGEIHVVTYGHLVETANKKLFGLREQLTDHYKDIGDDSIVEKALKEPKQLRLYT